VLSVLHRLDEGAPEGLIAELAPLNGADSPWRHTARELTGFLMLKQSDTGGAREQFQAMFDDPDTPNSARGRAREMLDALGEGGEAS